MSKQKYSDEFKLKIIREYEEHILGYKSLGKKYNVPHSAIRHWIGLYKKHGIEGLSKVNKNYNGDFKVNVIEYMLENHLSIRQTAIHFCISAHSISSWLKKYREKGKESLLKNNRGNKKLKMTRLKKIKINDKKKIKKEETPEEKIERLEIINAYLTEENELLKKKLLTKQQRAKE